MFERIGLFLIAIFLVVLNVGLILNFVSLFPFRIGQSVLVPIFFGLFGMGGALAGLVFSRRSAERLYGIQFIDPSTRDAGAREIYEMVARLARQAGLPEAPMVGIFQAPEPNAFCTGPSGRKYLVAFSSGLLRSMNPREVEAVAAHEISHVASSDMVTMTLLMGLANALVIWPARMVFRVIEGFRHRDSGEGGPGFLGYFAAVFVLDLFFMALASIPLAWFSRKREFRADLDAARLTSPGAMIDALRILGRAAEIPTPRDGFAMAKINSQRRVFLWPSHPSMAARISALENYRF